MAKTTVGLFENARLGDKIVDDLTLEQQDEKWTITAIHLAVNARGPANWPGDIREGCARS